MFTEKQKEDFYIRLYFNISDGFEYAGLRRAYLDFNRTLKIKNGNQEQRNLKRHEIEHYLKKELEKLVLGEFEAQIEFDNCHEKLCSQLLNEWDELTIGQAQKWINMTLKYWLLFGKTRINGIENNARFFHIPIDSYVQKGMFKEKNPIPWSKITSYNRYFDYQIRHRDKKTGNPPIIDELVFFNQLNNG